jgi:DNA repair protein RadA/Sms
MKIKSSYFCQSCGHQSPKWLGKCPACEQWNTFVEELVQKDDQPKKGEWRTSSSQKIAAKPRALQEINPLS